MADSKFSRYAAIHEPSKLAGPGDNRPTALQIIQDNNLVGAWPEKVILVTGCSSGIGVETARALKATGAKLYVTSRDLDKGRQVLRDILEEGKVELLQLKLDSLKSVRECAAEFQRRESKLNVLINNAGIMALPTRELSEDGFELQFATNHLGHFLLFQLLKSQLLAASTPTFASRVVNVSSIGHRMSEIHFDNINMSGDGIYHPWAGYGQSKTANVYMANQIEKTFGGKIHAHSLHPGGIRSPLQKYVEKDMSALFDDPEVIRHMKSPEQGAATSVWAAVDKVWEGEGGKFLEDCQVSGPVKEGEWMGGPGFAAWAYDEEKAGKLWQMSNEMVGFNE